MNAMRASVKAYVAIGANLGDARSAVHCAIKDLAALPQTRLLRQSSLYQTAPVEASGPDYINAVVELDTQLNAHALLLELQQLEQISGRERTYQNAPRTLDLDILLYGNATLSSPTLTVPHPRMAGRAFVLVPLAEIAPSLVTVSQLLSVSDQTITLVA
jgi:2-amino-4-hydroxy-6-hydroxymethyldihydropteridine diphosphokinase